MTPNTGKPEQIEFDTEVLPTQERVTRYRTLYGTGADITQTGSNPRATFRGLRLDRAFFYDAWLNDLRHSRDAESLPRYNVSHWTATLVLGGRMDVDLGPGLMHLEQGELLFINTKAPLRNEAHGVRVATLSIPGDAVEHVLGSLEGLHGLVVGAGDTRFYEVLVRSLLETLPTVNERALPGITTALGGLLRAAGAAGGRCNNTVTRTRDSVRLKVLRETIDGRLCDQDFGPERLVGEADLSRATIYRLLRPYGGLAAFVLSRRLEHLRRLLSNPFDRRQFGTIARAAGFRDEGQANRTFLARFGIRTGPYRTAVQRAEPDYQRSLSTRCELFGAAGHYSASDPLLSLRSQPILRLCGSADIFG